jgi:hypothetical protein
MLVRSVDVRIIAVRLGDTAFEVVRDDRPRCAAEVVERADVGSEPIPGALAEARLGCGATI